MNIPNQLQQVCIAIAQNAFIAALKQVSHFSVTAVVALRIGELNPLHDL